MQNLSVSLAGKKKGTDDVGNCGNVDLKAGIWVLGFRQFNETLTLCSLETQRSKRKCYNLLLDRLKCQVAHPFMRDRKNPDSSRTRAHEPNRSRNT